MATAAPARPVMCKLIIKSPNQRYSDQVVEGELDWTIKQLKLKLAEVYPSKPLLEEQRLIYSGQLLNDGSTLKDTLRQLEEGQECHTIHLVCAPQYNRKLYRPLPASQFSSTSTINVPMARLPTTESLVTNSSAASSIANTSANITTSTAPFAIPTSSAPSGSIRQRTVGTQPSTSHLRNQPPVYGAPPNADVFSLHFGNSGGMPSAPLPTSMTPGVNYDPVQMYQQMVWMQYAYAQYMQQYFQYYQDGGPLADPLGATFAQPPAADGPQANQPIVDQPQPDANRQPNRPNDRRRNNIRMNAQGGPVMDDDDDDEEMAAGGRANGRDLLDWFYIFSRIFVLFSILYFYASMERLILVIALIGALYLYRIGAFGRALPNPNQPIIAPMDNQPPADEPQPMDEMEPEEVDAQNPPANAVPQEPALREVIWTFVAAFFTSLIPEPPEAVAAN